MLLNRSPSWRQRSRPQPVNQAQNLSEQSSGDSDFRELESDITAKTHDLRADLDRLFAQRGQRPGPSRVPRYSAAATCFADLAFASAFASAWALALATAALAASLCSNISRCSSSASTTGLIARSM